MSARDPATRFADFDHIPIGLAVLDSNLEVLFWNRTLEQWTGTPREAMLGIPMDVVYENWTNRRYRERLAPLFEGGPPVVFSPVLHPGILPGLIPGQTFHVKASAVPHCGGTWLAVLSVEDVTLLYNRIEELRVLRTQQERLMREIHHRVKNNLNLISGLVSIKKSELQSPDELKPLDDLQSRIAAISEIHDLLYHSANLSLASSKDYLETLATLLNENLGFASNQRLTVQVAPDIVLKTDTTVLLGLIVAELMTNALKHGFRPGTVGELTVWLKRLADHDYELGLSQSENTLPDTFDPATSSGMGMVLIMAYAEQLKSRLQWERGTPTRFWLRFSE